MEKKLVDTYDHMTMPEDCTRQIETRLEAELQNRKNGQYTRVVSPFAPQRSGWVLIAACLLVLAVSGAALWLRMTRPVINIPESLTAEKQTATEVQPERELFREILSGESIKQGEMTVEEHCTALWGENTAVTAFTLTDMDDDGVNELIFVVEDADGVQGGYLVLRQEENMICAYTLWGRDLRKDGSVYSYTAKSNVRLKFENMRARHIALLEFNQQDKPLAQWHAYPCTGLDLVLESYRYASETGASTSPGYGYTYFEALAYGEMANDWNQLQYWMSREGICVEDGNMVYAYDPDAPGCVFYGTLTGEGQQRKFTAIGYYICDAAGEYRAEVFNLDSADPVFTVDPPTDDRGREVETAEEMMVYLGHEPYYDSVGRDVQQIAELLDGFVSRYSEHDTEGMREYMAETAGDLSSYPFTGKVSILTYGVLPGTPVNVGESWHTSVELVESGDTKAYYHLSVVLAKEPEGWKIHAYSLEKQ